MGKIHVTQTAVRFSIMAWLDGLGLPPFLLLFYNNYYYILLYKLLLLQVFILKDFAIISECYVATRPIFFLLYPNQTTELCGSQEYVGE